MALVVAEKSRYISVEEAAFLEGWQRVSIPNIVVPTFEVMGAHVVLVNYQAHMHL